MKEVGGVTEVLAGDCKVWGSYPLQGVTSDPFDSAALTATLTNPSLILAAVRFS